MLTQRLGSESQKNPIFIDSLIAQIKAHPGSCDEVWLASSYGFPKQEDHKKLAAQLMETAERFRSAGVRVSLQISNTIGHGQYMSSRDCTGLIYEGSPVEHMTGPDGTRAEYCFCWNGAHFREYVLAELREYAKLKPYCVWVDDDLRANNHAPVNFGCFCDDCMARFNRLYGSSFTREELVNELTCGETVWRERYTAFVRDGLHDFTLQMAKVIHSVSPESRMGYQYCSNGAYTGYDYSFIFDAMRDGTGHAPLSRPGGGAYDDKNPGSFIDKMWFMNWANYRLPEYVNDIRPEIENLPDVKFGKSIAGTAFETSLYFAGGATAMSYALLMNDYEPMEWHGEMLGEFAKHRKYWEALSEINLATTQAGIKIANTKFNWRYRLPDNKTAFYYNTEPEAHPSELLRCGVPLCFGNEINPVYYLTAETAKRLSAEEIEELLCSPVLTDGRTLAVLSGRGYDFGAEAYPVSTLQTYEKYLPHPITEGCENKRWSQSFSFHEGYALKHLGSNCKPFAYYAADSRNVEKTSDESDFPYGIAGATINTGKAVWAVFGQCLENSDISLDKRNLILRAADYISQNRVPAILETGLPAMLLARENSGGQIKCVSIVNMTVGESGTLKLRIRRPASEKFRFMSMNGEAVPSFVRDGSDYIVDVPSIAGWSVGTVFAD